MMRGELDVHESVSQKPRALVKVVNHIENIKYSPKKVFPFSADLTVPRTVYWNWNCVIATDCLDVRPVFQNDLVRKTTHLKHFRSCGITIITGIRARVLPFPQDIQKLQFDGVIEWDVAFLETEFAVSSHFLLWQTTT